MEAGAYDRITPITEDSLPRNPCLEYLAAGIAAAHGMYGNPDAMVLFVIEDPDVNTFDQRRIEYCLLDQYCIRTIRMTLSEIANSVRLDGDGGLMVPSINTWENHLEHISVVYFRTGYTPDQYPSNREWNARQMLEMSRAIKCPNIITQLSNLKKVQQVLTMPGVLERYRSQKCYL